MYSTIILSHGDFANGLKDTMMMIAGSQEETYFISFSPSDSVEDFEKKVKVIYHSIPKDHKILMLTDLYGGTPNNIASGFCFKYPDRIEVISGVNLPMLLTATLSRHMELESVIEKIVGETQSSIRRLEKKHEVNEEDE